MTLRAGLVDLRPLVVSPAFRRLWVGTSLSAIGQQVTLVAVLFQVWQLTGSPLWTGMVGLTSAVPFVVLGLVGGSLADAVDRRTLVRWTTLGQALSAFGLAGQALAGLDSLGVVLALVATQSAFTALGAPARRTFPSRLLPRPLVAAGIALQHLSFQGAMLAGPALAGLVIGQVGLVACYVTEAVTFLVALYAVVRLPALPPLAAEPHRAGLRSVADGLRQVVRTPPVRGAFGVDLCATLLAMPVALFPAVNERYFGGAPETLGLFLTAVAVGGTLAGVASGLVTRAARPGVVQLWAAAVWGAALTAFGLQGSLGPALAALAVAGAADTVGVIARGALVQLATPDSHRGRVSSADYVIGVAGPEVGNARAGMVAAVTSAPVALVSGGLLCLAAVAWIGVRNAGLRGFRPADVEDEAVRDDALRV